MRIDQALQVLRTSTERTRWTSKVVSAWPAGGPGPPASAPSRSLRQFDLRGRTLHCSGTLDPLPTHLGPPPETRWGRGATTPTSTRFQTRPPGARGAHGESRAAPVGRRAVGGPAPPGGTWDLGPGPPATRPRALKWPRSSPACIPSYASKLGVERQVSGDEPQRPAGVRAERLQRAGELRVLGHGGDGLPVEPHRVQRPGRRDPHAWRHLGAPRGVPRGPRRRQARPGGGDPPRWGGGDRRLRGDGVRAAVRQLREPIPSVLRRGG